jgi:type I restriction enzyme S subunit
VTRKIGSGATPTGGEAAYLPARLRYALVRSQNVFDRHFAPDGLAFISDEQAARLRGVELAPGDVLLNITGDGVTFGRACIVPSETLPACVNQHVSIVRADPRVLDPGYLLAFLTHPLVKPYIESFNAGGSRRAITKGHIESFCIPLPSLPVQRDIAFILGVLDDKINLNQRMNQTLEELARTIFKSWFVDFDPVRAKAEGRKPVGMDAETAALFPSRLVESELGAIPDGWQAGTLGDLIELKRGYDLPTAQRRDGLVPICSSSGISGLHDEAKVKAPGVVTGRYGTIGQVFFLDEDFWPLNTTLYVRDFKGNEPRFVFYALGRVRFANYTDKAAVPGLNRNHVHEDPLILPPVAIQARFSDLCGPFWDRCSANTIESKTLAELRDLLLPKLISGELRVPTAEKMVEAAL